MLFQELELLAFGVCGLFASNTSQEELQLQGQDSRNLEIGNAQVALALAYHWLRVASVFLWMKHIFTFQEVS